MEGKELERVFEAAENVDWNMAAMNAPPCFYVEIDGRFCGHSDEWFGHFDEQIHKFVSLKSLLVRIALDTIIEV